VGATRVLRQSVEWERGEVVLDAGCGTAREALKLKNAGLNVVCLDFVDARIGDARLMNYIDVCLWEAKGLPKFDWVFCCDVAEHLPTEHVDQSLDNLQRATRMGGLLQIALFNDGFGKYIGETLHLTVKPAEWWDEKIKKRWHVTMSHITKNHFVATLGPPK
jgi:SAM-dependent methyltransferase